VKSRRALVLAVLVYVALDFSSPAIPGAFVFEPGDSVESVGRARTIPSIFAAPTLLGGISTVVPAGLQDEPRVASVVIVPTPAPPPRRPARTATESTSESDDPH
jgi:hypothetical protein